MTESKKFHTMPFIPDKRVYAAVTFALKLREEMDTAKAIYRAARYYKVPMSDVAYYVGKTGANKATKNRIWGAYQRGRREE